MANEFKIISEDGLKTLCKAIKKVSTIGEILDDANSVTDKTYSSFEIDRRLNTKIDKTQLTAVLDETVTDEQIPGAKVVVDELGLKANDSEVVKKTDIATTLNNTVTNEQVAGAKVIVDELGLKANDSEVVKKTDIATTLDSTVTDEQIPGAKAVYNTTSKFLKTYTSIEQLGLTSGSETIENIANSMESRTRLIAVIEGGNLSIYPNTSGTLIVEKLNIYRVHFKFCMDGLPTVFVGTYHAVSGFTGWHRICTTTVADVPAKRVAVNNWATGDVVYTVKNGICYVWISALASSTMDTSNQIIVNNLPVPKSPGLWCSIGSNDCTKGTLLVLVGTSGELKNYSGLNNAQYFGSFSYPVAE